MTDNEYEIDESLPRATGLIWTPMYYKFQINSFFSALKTGFSAPEI